MVDNRIEEDSLAVATSQAQEESARNTFTILPGVIESYDPATQLAQIRIALKTKVNGEAIEYPMLEEVPVRSCSRVKNFAITYPIKKGDEVELHVYCRSIDNWFTEGGIVDPDDARTHDLSDIVAYVGNYSLPNTIESVSGDNLEIRTIGGESRITISPDGSYRIYNPNGEITLSPDGTIRAQNANGFAVLDASGVVGINGVTIQPNGSANFPSSVTATGSISAGGSIQSGGNISAAGAISASGRVSGSNIS